MANGLSVDVNTLLDKYQEIASVDEQLDAASGSEQAGKRALANSVSAETQKSWEKPVSNLVKTIQGFDSPELIVGTYTAIQKALRDNFQEQVDKFLTELAASRQSETVTLTPEQLEELNTARKQLVEEYKAIANILEMFKFDISGVPTPKKRTGSRGPRGPRVFGRYVFSIDGKERTASQNSLSSIANTVCKDLGWATADLRNFLVENGFDVENPPETFEVVIPDPVNKTLTMVLSEDEDEGEDSVEEAEVPAE
jgi:hypothetical protein